MPRAAQAFVEFSQILRGHGFAIAPEQTTDFIHAVGLLGPRELMDIRRAGRATLSIPQERLGEYDALFRAFFMGQAMSAPVSSDEDEDEVEAHEQSEGEQEAPLEEDERETGEQAARAEVLARRAFGAVEDDETIARFRQQAPSLLPRRRSPRRRAWRKGDRFDLRRSLRQAVKRDGEIFELLRTRRKTRQRAIVLLIDVSGSMKEQSQSTLRFAHALMAAADRAEVFTFGTRLTRITSALRDRNAERALDKVGGLVADFDGGTRIGDALGALLAVPRFAGLMRGASVVIVSDGLERGSPQAMLEAVKRLSRTAWRLTWLTPLASDNRYQPRTEALSAVLPWLDDLGSAADLQAISETILALATMPRRRAA
ncbi:MAG: VWA domain-containing protein [Rhodobiaceae bacterium]|nr:VWA domain-containing protein [Rhodobiaceae bacterium]